MKTATHEHDRVNPSTVLVEHARVRLRRNLPDHDLRAGTKGTVVHVYDRGSGVEVEFGANGESPTVIMLNSDAVEPLTD